KSAAEKHAAQLEKWVANHYGDSGTAPKGLLVVNTWRDTPLVERTGEDFPAQMLPFSQSRGHCLATGLDLFVTRAEIQADASRAVYWRQKMLATAGRLADVPDWRSVLLVTETATPPER